MAMVTSFNSVHKRLESPPLLGRLVVRDHNILPKLSESWPTELGYRNGEPEMDKAIFFKGR